MRGWPIVVLIALALTPQVLAQSLGEMARRDRARVEKLQTVGGGATEPAAKPCTATAMPRVASHASPLRYPPEAIRERLEGKVLLNVIVGEDGSVAEAKVNGPADRRLAEAARDFVLKTRYCPAIQDGVPMRAQIPVSISFKLPGRAN
jgi:protein TonB